MRRGGNRRPSDSGEQLDRNTRGAIARWVPRRWVIAVVGGVILVLAGCATSRSVPDPATEKTARVADDRATTLPVNQTLTPLGLQIPLPGLRPQVLALSPNGKLLVVSGKTSEVVVLDAASGAVRQRVPLPIDTSDEALPQVVSPNILKFDQQEQASYTGLVFSPDGARLFLSEVNGSIKVFSVAPDGNVTPMQSRLLPLANAPRRKREIPAGLAVSREGSKIYVCGNLSNTLLELESETGRLLRSFDVGVAPYDVVLVGRKAYVSNWGGRRPSVGDLTGPAGRGTVVRVDPVRHIASEGSVSVVDLARGSVTGEIRAGLHASALAVSPGQRYVVCANAGSDSITVIDTRTDEVAETISVKTKPNDLFGASPNALVFDPTGRVLYVANGTQNAVAVVHFDPADRESKLTGLIPVGWFPGAIAFDQKHRRLAVANIKGVPVKARASGSASYNSQESAGSVSLLSVPAERELPELSETVLRNLRRDAITASTLPPRSGQPPRPVPERIGEPSVFKHVVYIIKENRTYDQVLGDLPQGNGDPSLCIFGREITPNQHKLASEFVLLDNTYCSGILSADGHQWSTTAFATDYMEKSFAGFPRSYPDGMGQDEDDALAYSPAGFLWDNALAHRKSFRNYGEFAAPQVRWRDPARSGAPQFMDCYRQWKGESNEVSIGCHPMVPTLEPFVPMDYVGWAMEVPDQYRADFFIRELKAFEQRGEFPELVLICLPNDHTSGTRTGSPTPAACVADNDLALGRIVEAITQSQFWRDTVIFAIEDDPQDGWDHVTGYRTTAYCISQYTKRGATVSTLYNTTSILRTIEQILGLPPMNQFDASATPMSDCFTAVANPTPFSAVSSNVSLTELNPPPTEVQNKTLRRDAEASARMNFREVDRAPEDELNQILWRAMRGPDVPYPSWAVARSDDDEEEKRELPPAL